VSVNKVFSNYVDVKISVQYWKLYLTPTHDFDRQRNLSPTILDANTCQPRSKNVKVSFNKDQMAVFQCGIVSIERVMEGPA